MARIELKEGMTWEKTQAKLAAEGIILTHRQHRKGGYVCYASKKLRIKMKMYQIRVSL